MPQNMTVQTSIAANATNDNVFQGKRFERAVSDCFLSLYTTGSAGGLQQELNVGGRSISPRDVVNTQNRVPVVPDDLVISDVPVYQGELIQLTVSNTTGGALTHNARIVLEEAVRTG